MTDASASRRLGFALAAVAALCASVADAQAPHEALAPRPLADADRAIFLGSPEDPPAPVLLGIDPTYYGAHYLAGDELHPDSWYPHARDLGGGYVGVGTDQTYLFVGWQRPTHAWSIDYDPLVVDLHAVYRAFFLEDASQEAFVARWSPAGEKAALEVLERRYAEHPRLAAYRAVYLQARTRVARRFELLRALMRHTRVPSFLDDPATYAFVRGMVEAGRIRPMSANLLERGGLAGIAESARRLGVPIRGLYLSNAEEYWSYGETFRANVRALPFDARTMVFRSLAAYRHNRDYRYGVQPGLLYQKWLGRPQLVTVRQLMAWWRPLPPGKVDLVVTTIDPDDVPAFAAGAPPRRGAPDPIAGVAPGRVAGTPPTTEGPEPRPAQASRPTAASTPARSAPEAISSDTAAKSR